MASKLRKSGLPGRGNAIRAWRQARRMTLEDLAARIGTTGATLSRIERGLQPYSQPILERISERLGCEPSDLVMRTSRDKEQIEIWTVITGLSDAQRVQALRVLRALLTDAA